jgi:hypothetical protein
MEDPIHSLGSTGRTCKRRSNADGNKASANPSSQETKEGPKKVDLGKRRGKADRNPEGEERDQQIVEAS